ncbi:MAG: Peptidyl-prolyl cis-trans isomerase [Parcubacteria group bacterium GW2011_GWA2_49_9]|nr:MAG: Peptidyl-prolyl cis-trans isomerase [Parcubacteria group bacterium GW2011_GWA2_49_9]
MNLSKPSHLLGLVVALIIVGVAGYFFINMKTTNSKQEPAAASATPAVQAAAQTAPSSVTGAVIKTNLGDIEVVFFGSDAPKTVDNFRKLADTGFYAGTKFHRVIKGFMIQGGDPLTKDDTQKARWGSGGPGYQFEDEFNGNKLVRGVLAMANAGPNTNGSQFFIVTSPATPWLDGKHTAFGKVVKGMDVVDKIENTPVGPNDVPKTAVVVQEIILK